MIYLLIYLFEGGKIGTTLIKENVTKSISGHNRIDPFIIFTLSY